MEINQILYIEAVVEYGSYRKAAKVLGISQPAITKAIGKLEKELGGPIFVRNESGVRLSVAGEKLIPYCNGIVEYMNSGIACFKEAQDLEKGKVSIAISNGIFLKHLVAEFINKYPEISFNYYLMNEIEMVQALEEGTIDFAVNEEPFQIESMKWEHLHKCGLRAMLNKDDPLLGKKSISMHELRNHQFCIGNISSTMNTAVLRLCRDSGFTPHIRYMGYDRSICGMLLNLPNTVIISTTAIDAGVKAANRSTFLEECYVDIDNTYGLANIGIISKKGHYQSKAALEFKRMLTAYYSTIDEKK